MESTRMGVDGTKVSLDKVLEAEIISKHVKDSSQASSPLGILPRTVRDYGAVQRLDELDALVNDGIKVVSFDFMDTLVQWTSSVMERHVQMYKATERIFRRYGFDISSEEYQVIRKDLWYDWKAKHSLKGTDFKALDLLTKIVEKTLDYKGITTSKAKILKIAQEIEQKNYDIERETAVAVPKARETLRKLKEKGLITVVYSNTPFSSEHVKRTLRECGLEKYIDHIATSSEQGFLKSKHHPQGFQKLAFELKQKYGLKQCRGSILHIGDNHDEDYLGGLNAGLCTAHFKPAKSYSKRLKSFSSIGSKEYKQKAVHYYKEALDQKVRDIVNESLDHNIISDEMHDFMLRVYHIARDVYGPTAVYFARRRLKSLEGNKKKIAVCLGRDGLGIYEIMKELLTLSPTRFKGVNPEQLKYVNFSRKVANKALQDGHFDFPIGHEGAEGKRLAFPREGEGGCKGYKRLLRQYLAQEGFDQAEEIRLIDSGLQGSTQSTIQALYSEWRNKIQGRYLYNFQKLKDPYRKYKQGYLLQVVPMGQTGQTDRRNEYKGDRFYLDQHLIYFFEDLFNGADQSNCHLDEVDGQVKPRIKKMRYNSGVNPDRVLPPLKSAQVYQLAKEVLLEGLRDSARLNHRAWRLNQNGEYHEGIFPTEDDAHQILKQYLRGYLAYVKGKNREHKDGDIFDALIRRVDYVNNEEEYKRKWEEQIQP